MAILSLLPLCPCNVVDQASTSGANYELSTYDNGCFWGGVKYMRIVLMFVDVEHCEKQCYALDY